METGAIFFCRLAEITDEQALDVFHVTSKEEDCDGVNYDELFQVKRDAAAADLCGARRQSASLLRRY